MGSFLALLSAALCLISTSAAEAAQPSGTNRLIQADLLYLTRDRDNRDLQCMEVLESLLASNTAKEDDVLWRMARLEKWLGDQAAGSVEKLKHYERAKGYAQRGVNKGGRCVECHFWLGVAYGKIGQTRGVMSSLFLVSSIKAEMKQVLSMDPQHSGAHHVMGVVYRSIPWLIGGSIEKSIEELVRAVQLNGDNTIHYLELAKSYAAAGETKNMLNALDALEQVSEPYDPIQAKVDRRTAAHLRQELTGI